MPRDIEVEVKGQIPANAKAEGLRSRDLRSGDQRNQVVSLNQEVLGHKAMTWAGG